MCKRALAPLHDYFQTDYILPVGSGTAGIRLALQLLDARRQVIVPAATCPNVVVAVLAAGAEPVPADVREQDFTLSPTTVAAALTPETGAILAIDSFGCPADVDGLRRVTGNRPPLLIEDACQAYGGSAGGVPLGRRGDIGVLSFGYAKPLPLNGGGLLISRTREIHEELAARSRHASTGFRAECKNGLAVKMMHRGRFRLFARLARRGLLEYRFPPRSLSLLARSWPAFAAAIAPMQQIHRRIAELLAAIPGALPLRSDSPDWLPWRPSVILPPAERSRWFADLNRQRIPVSRLYRPLAEAFRFSIAAHSPQAQRMADGIINLICPDTAPRLSILHDRLREFLSARGISAGEPGR